MLCSHNVLPQQAEEKNLKRVRRKIKNRQSAYDSRRRKKEYVDGLEERVERSTEANHALQQQVGRLQEQNKMLIGQLRRLQKLVAQYNPSALQAGACVMVSVMGVGDRCGEGWVWVIGVGRDWWG